LIFSAVVGFSALCTFGGRRDRILLVLFFVAACFPPRGNLVAYSSAARLLATVGMFALFLHVISRHRKTHFSLRYASAASVAILILFVVNLRALAYRNTDFQRRVAIPTQAFRYANPIAASGQKFLFTEMLTQGYVAAVLEDNQVATVLLPGDALSMAGSMESPIAYAESSALQSDVYGLNVASRSSDRTVEGYQPAMSADGRWLAFLREDGVRNSVWLLDTTSKRAPQLMYTSRESIFEMTVTAEGDLILAKGSTISSHLFLIRRETRAITVIEGIPGSVRYPALSSDGTRLAFSRRDGGSWHLNVRDLRTGAERQLAYGSCNALAPSWESRNTLLYATDCGRGLGLSALARVKPED
jgi:Tol biopolymer transport system component